MNKNLKNQIKSTFFTTKVLNLLDDSKPLYSMMILAMAIVENCFEKKYRFRTPAMEKRLRQYGVLPKSFFRESFLRSTKLMNLIKDNGLTIDELLEKVIESGRLNKIILLDRKELKTFYSLIQETNDEK